MLFNSQKFLSANFKQSLVCAIFFTELFRFPHIELFLSNIASCGNDHFSQWKQDWYVTTTWIHLQGHCSSWVLVKESPQLNLPKYTTRYLNSAQFFCFLTVMNFSTYCLLGWVTQLMKCHCTAYMILVLSLFATRLGTVVVFLNFFLVCIFLCLQGGKREDSWPWAAMFLWTPQSTPAFHHGH